MTQRGPGAFRCLQRSLAASVLLAGLLAAGAVAASPEQRPEAHDASVADVVSLTHGADVAPLEAPAADADDPRAAEVEGAVEAELRRHDRVRVIVRLREQADLPSLAGRARAVGRARGQDARVAEVVRGLRAVAGRSQGAVDALLRAEEKAGRARDVRSFWIFNGFAATVGRAALDRLAAHPDVESIELDEELSLPETESAPRLPTWGLEKVNAPKTWGDYGFTGDGVVVGVMDSGVDGGHPALKGAFRGRDGDLASSWYPATGENYPTPGDGHGHGTHVTGTIVGGPPGDVIGVAPDAEWIAVKIFRDSGSTTTSIIHDGFQWMLAPGGDPEKAPDVVNNSWGSTATNSVEFLPDVRAWVAAGIFPAFANGNSGPGSGTVGSPASFPESFGVGATDIEDQIASFSSRGPAIWDGVTHVKPQVSAPGHQIYSSWPRQLGMDYHTISGTSMATPHLTGVVALLLSAQPALSVDEIRNVLTASARREAHMGKLPNNDYGHGIADAFAAITLARFSGTLTGTVRGPDGPIAGARVSVPALGVEATTDGAGVYELRVREGSGEAEVSVYGYAGAQADYTIEAGATVTLDFELDAAAVHTLSGTVTAAGAPVAGARVRVAETPLETAFTGDDGRFSFAVAAGEYDLVADATGYRRATRHLVLDADASVQLELEPLPGAVATGWREYQNNPSRTGLSADELASAALTQAWSVDLPGAIMFASPVVAGGRIHVAFDGGQLMAFDLDDGKTLWSFAAGPNLRSTPLVAGGRVYFGGGDSGVFHALDAATGAPVWSFATGDRLTYTTPTLVDGTVYFGTGWGTGNGGWVYALDAATGALRWKTFVGGQIYFAPAVAAGKVYAASYDARKLVALDAATGSVEWSLTRTTDSFAAMPSYDDGRLYVATNDFDTGVGSVLAVDAETGATLWEASGHGDAAGNAPVVYGDLVIAGSSTKNWVVAYDRATGARRWTSSIGAAVSNSQLGADGVIVGGSQQDRRVWALDAYTGDLLWEDTLSSNVLSAPALADGRLVVADRFGVVRAYDVPGTVTGTVTDSSGAPLDAEVRVPETGASIRTDATGSFELRHRPGEYAVEAYSYGYLAGRAELRIRSGQPTRHDFELAAAGTGSLGGVVRDEGGNPLAGARVELSGTPLGPAVSGEDGAFAFGEVAEGTYRLVVTLPGYVTLEQEVTVGDGEETAVTLTLLRYQIAVTGDRENAITRYLEGKGYRVESTTAAAIADHPGAYELIVANGSQDDPGEEPFRRLLENADAAETSVLFLDTWGISYGSLLHLSRYTGDPPTTASGFNDGEVSLIARVEHPLTAGLPLGQRVPALPSNHEWASFSGYSGRSLADVYIGRTGATAGSGIGYAPRTFGSVHVLLSLHGASPWTGPTSGWTSAAAAIFDNAVGYGLGASFGGVEGTVTDALGAPVQAKVSVAETGDSTTAAADGGYRLLLPPGTYTLRFERIGYTTEERTVEVTARAATAADVVLAASGAGGISGIVTSTAGGGPIDGAVVRVLDTELEPAITGPDGRFSIDGVPGGTYDVQVSAERFRTEVVADVVVEDGAATELAVQLRPSLRAAVIGDANGLAVFLNASEVTATATGWEAIANLGEYDVVVVNQPTDPGRPAFLAHLDALDAAGKSAIFTEGNFSTSGGARLLRLHVGDPAVNAQVGTTAGNRYLRPLVEGHPLFEGVTLTDGIVEILAAARRTGYSNEYSGITLASFGANDVDLGIGAAYEPRTPTSIRLLLGPLGSHSSASPANGWTEDGRRVFLNAVEWAANPGLGAVAGRVVDAAGEPLAFASVRLVESDQQRDVDEGGNFLVPHAPGDFTLEASAFGYQTRQVSVRIDAGRTTQVDVELALADVGTIAGTVTGRGTISGASEDGQPIEGAEITVVGFPRSATTAADGTFAIERLEPGTYDVEVRAAGFVSQVLRGVPVAAGETSTRDASLRPSPRVAVVDDCQQTAGCVDKMQGYLAEWGYLPEEISWTDHARLEEFDLVVANLGDFPRLDPTAAGLAAFQDSANRAHVPVIWLEQFQRGSIRWLSEYENDPVSVGEARSQGLVEAEVVADHPLVAGFSVGERVPIVSGGSFEHTWFNGFSGTTVADLRTATGGVKGSTIAYRGRTASSVDVLFSSFAASFYTWPPVGGAPAQLLTPQAEQLFHNALDWALDAPPLAGEVRGTVSSSVGGALASTVTVLETGKTYEGREGDGTFLVPLQPGEWTLEVKAFGHQTRQLAVSIAAGTVRNLAIVLQADDVGTVAGTVTDDGGAPVEGASVELEGTPLATTTDAAGAYRIERVPAGQHTLLVRKSGFGHRRIPVTIASGATTRVDVRLEPSRVIAVAGDFQNRLTTFLTDSGYAPVQWSWTNIHQHVGDLDDVELVILNGSGTQPTAANLSTFVAAAAAADRSLVFAGQNGTGSIRTLRTTFNDPATVTQGFVPNAIYYRPAVEHPIFAGFPAGQPIELIVNAPNQQWEQFGGYSGQTIAAVESATAAIGGGVGYRFATPASVHLLLASLGVSSFGAPDSRWTDNARRIYLNAVEWALEAAQAEVFGTVTSEGAPVADAQVTAVERGASTRTGAGGEYRLGLPGGTHTIRVTAVGYEAFEQVVELGEEERLQLDVELVPVERGAIGGTVTDLDGGPIPGAAVTLTGPQEGETVTAPGGTFGFENLLPGEYALAVRAVGFVEADVPVTVAPGQTATVTIELRGNDVAVLGDVEGALVELLRARGEAAEERSWSELAADVGRYDVVVVNGGDPTAEQFEALVDAADAAGTSLVVTGTWGVLQGGLRLLAQHRPDEVEIAGHGYRTGAVELTGFDAAHPLFADLPTPLEPVATDGYWSAIGSYVGPYLADLAVETDGPQGVSVAYDFRSANSVHLLLSAGAASDFIGPGYGWTAAGEQLFLNAVGWARDVQQALPAQPTLAGSTLVPSSPATLTGTAEFRSSVTILRDGVPVAEAEPGRDGSFSVDVELVEGPSTFTAVAENYAGASPASAPLTVTLDTTPPAFTWTPADGTGFFEPDLVVSGTATDVHAGVAEVLVNGRPATLTADGGFAADVTLAEGVNELTVVARDQLGNEASETRRVAFFDYDAAWQVAGAHGHGTLTAFLDLSNAAGDPVQVESAVAELVREDGTVETSAAMHYDTQEERYRANLGKPPAGTYTLRGLLVVSGFDIRVGGPAVVRTPERRGAGVP